MFHHQRFLGRRVFLQGLMFAFPISEICKILITTLKTSTENQLFLRSSHVTVDSTSPLEMIRKRGRGTSNRGRHDQPMFTYVERADTESRYTNNLRPNLYKNLFHT